MPVTLLEAKKNVQDALQMGVIDEFAKSNYILQTMPFDDAVSPTGGGATHVEFGHRTRLGTGKIKSKVGGIHFVPGRFYMKGAFDTKRDAAVSRLMSVLKGE